MRILTTGVDGEGRSCVVAVREITVEPKTIEGPHFDVAFPTTALPYPPRPPGVAQFIDLEVPAAHCLWHVATLPPDYETPMHHTDTIDFDTMLAGSIVLILDDGEHLLEPGDVVLVTGVDHAWRTGPEGASLSILLQGTVSPAEA